MKKKGIISIITFFFVLQAKAQCAMCRAVLESGEDQSAAEGINDGIMFLMVVPYILVAVIGFYVYRTFSKSKRVKK
ncbi:hypothetical protein [Winogradskyella aquimaris]|uniref:Uncharacterized protein n=1 Tax=Winogradskyella aquimaris TaxID=864074 RepID=A0ABU5EJR9_9FLAO|nr:hypothetical protein [Winogradskyella aquimaris]MDY2586237.1 hypothetical protein [Winogradskyella aquimaris]